MQACRWLGVVACATALLAVGCGGRQVLNVSNVPVVTSKSTPSADDVAKAIIRAGINTNWRINEAGPGQLLGVRTLGAHSASINISYSPQSYGISLKDTTMVEVQSARGGASPPGGAAAAAQERQTIHRTYNRWVQELDQQIRSQLGAI
jgi:hypothetical protein